MRSDKAQAVANMPTRQKITAIVVVVVVLIILWQVYGIFFSGGGSNPTPKPATPTANKPAMMSAATPAGGPSSPAAGGGQAQAPQPTTPKTAELSQPQPMSEAEAALVKMQQETQAKYVEAMNQLQLLKVARDIAMTNKDISTANLATVVSNKKIVDTLTPATPPSFQQVAPAPSPSQVSAGEANYTVISVSQLQYRWSAVISYQNNLFNVHVGDVLPPDGSTVVSIAKDGVVLMKDGVKKKISLVPVV